MPDLCDQLIELLGKPGSNSVVLKRMIQDIGERPILHDTHPRLWFYDFPQSGISLDFDSKHEMFTALTLFITIVPDENGDLGPGRPYSGKLPYGINRSDTFEEVEAKLPGGATTVKDYRFHADLRPLWLSSSTSNLEYPNRSCCLCQLITCRHYSSTKCLRDCHGGWHLRFWHSKIKLHPFV